MTLVGASDNRDLTKIRTAVVRSKSGAASVGDDGIEQSSSFGLIAGLTDAQGFINWEFGELVGIRVLVYIRTYWYRRICIKSDYDQTEYRQEKGTSMNGNDIVGIYYAILTLVKLKNASISVED